MSISVKCIRTEIWNIFRIYSDKTQNAKKHRRSNNQSQTHYLAAKMSGNGQSRENVQRSRCQIDRSTLKSSSLPSIKGHYRKTAVRQGVKVPSPDIVQHILHIVGDFQLCGIGPLLSCDVVLPRKQECTYSNASDSYRHTRTAAEQQLQQQQLQQHTNGIEQNRTFSASSPIFLASCYDAVLR